MSMRICTDVHMYTCTDVQMYRCTHAHMHICAYARVRACVICICMCICAYASVSVFVFVFVLCVVRCVLRVLRAECYALCIVYYRMPVRMRVRMYSASRKSAVPTCGSSPQLPPSATACGFFLQFLLQLLPAVPACSSCPRRLSAGSSSSCFPRPLPAFSRVFPMVSLRGLGVRGEWRGRDADAPREMGSGCLHGHCTFPEPVFFEQALPRLENRADRGRCPFCGYAMRLPPRAGVWVLLKMQWKLQ